MGIDLRVTLQLIESMHKALPAWKELIHESFMSDDLKETYLELVETRLSRLKE